MKPDDSITSTASANNTVTYTRPGWTRAVLAGYTLAGWWGILDTIGHKLNVPRKLMRPVCDMYEIACGIPKADLIRMDYPDRTPWWLRY